MATVNADIKKMTNLVSLPINLITVVDGFNVREDFGDLKELAHSIAENGIKVPVRGYVENGEYFLVDGERRIRASEIAINELGAAELKIPFLIEAKGTSEEQRIKDMWITNDGKPFTMLERAKAVKRMVDLGDEERNIATKLGKSITYISNLLKLEAVPNKVKKLIQKNKVSATFVVELIKAKKLEDFVANMDAYLKDPTAKPEENEDEALNDGSAVSEGAEGSEGTATKKVAQVTSKDIVLNSVKEMKRFLKGFDTPTPDTEKTYWFVKGLIDNELTYDDIMTFFAAGVVSDNPGEIAAQAEVPQDAPAKNLIKGSGKKKSKKTLTEIVDVTPQEENMTIEFPNFDGIDNIPGEDVEVNQLPFNVNDFAGNEINGNEEGAEVGNEGGNNAE